MSALEDEKSILYNEHTSIDPSPVALIDSSQEASLTYDLMFHRYLQCFSIRNTRALSKENFN